MCKTRKFLNHVTIFATVATTGLIIANILSDSVGIFKSNRKIHKLKAKLEKANDIC